MEQAKGKTCSICGEWHNYEEFSYGNRENRSYCLKCSREEKRAYSSGGAEAATAYRENQRAKWKNA